MVRAVSMVEEIYISDHSEPTFSPVAKRSLEIVDLVTPPKKNAGDSSFKNGERQPDMFEPHPPKFPAKQLTENRSSRANKIATEVCVSFGSSLKDATQNQQQPTLPKNKAASMQHEQGSIPQTPTREPTEVDDVKEDKITDTQSSPCRVVEDPISSDPFAISDNDDYHQLSKILEGPKKSGLSTEQNACEARSSDPLHGSPPKKRARRSLKPAAASRSKSVKLYTDRKETVRDMTVELWSDAGEWCTKLAPRINELGASVTQPEKPNLDGIALMMGFTRMLQDRWDPVERLFVSCSPYKNREPLHVVILSIDKFDRLCAQSLNEKKTFFTRIQAIAKTTCIFIVPGLIPLIRRRANEHNRAVQRHARSFIEGSQEVSPLSKPADHEYYSEQQVILQVRLGVKILYPTSESNCMEWLLSIIQDTSLARYKRMQDEGPSVRSGKSDREITIQALIKIHKVTPRIAVNIAQNFGTVGRLIYKLKKEGTPVLTDLGIVGQSLATQIRDTLCTTNAEQVV